MANILEKYGIKEVADVSFYKIDKTTGKAGDLVLYLDTLKVSTIEQTAEQVDARGGKGNPRLVTWDYNKDITVTLEDALFSAKSMAVMFGDGTVSTATATVKKTVRYTADSTAFPSSIMIAGSTFAIPASASWIDALTDTVVTSATSGRQYICTFDYTSTSNGTIHVDSNTFPGTYYVVGDTYARSEITGEDEFFQFVIPKAKMTSENTITLEAEGDPSVFNLNLTVLKAQGQPLMELIKYDVPTT